jgi:hypothetical protein
MAGRPGRSGRKPKWTDEKIAEAAEDLLRWLEEDTDHIWFRDWAIENNVPPEYLSRWAAKSAVFRQAVETAEMAQESRLVNGGLKNKLNSRIVALVLESRHRWAGRQSLTVAQEGSRMTLADILQEQMPADPAEARQWLQSIADGQGVGAEADAVRDAAEHQIKMLDTIELARALPSAIVV